MTEQKTCEQRIDAELASRIEDISLLMRAANADDIREFTTDERDTLAGLGVDVDEFDSETARTILDEYPLSIGVRTVCTVQLSWGGPSDEFEFDIEDGRIESAIVYRFKDWFDGASRTVDDESVEAWLSSLAEIAQYA